MGGYVGEFRFARLLDTSPETVEISKWRFIFDRDFSAAIHRQVLARSRNRLCWRIILDHRNARWMTPLYGHSIEAGCRFVWRIVTRARVMLTMHTGRNNWLKPRGFNPDSASIFRDDGVSALPTKRS
jgi:hypothetical protein